MFQKPAWGTDCAICPRRTVFGETKSEFQASDICQFCCRKVCSNHTEAPFGDDNRVRCCSDCIPRLARSYKEHEGPKGPTRSLRMPEFVREAWVARYSTETFSGYGPHPGNAPGGHPG